MAYRHQFTCAFGFTLLGTKPASIMDEWENRYLFHHHRLRPDLSAQFLQSMTHVFAQSPNFIFKRVDRYRNWWSCELINVAAVQQLIDETPELQEFTRANYENMTNFYAAMHDPKIGIFELLKWDAYCIGLVLGYGKTNAAYYCQRIRIGRQLDRHYLKWCQTSRHCDTCGRPGLLMRDIEIPYAKRPPQHSQGFNSVMEEWDWLCRVWWNLRVESEPKAPFFIYLPRYICRHGGDSEAVRENYVKAAERLAELFHEKSFQQAVCEVAHHDGTWSM